jgi:hypothetical protein
MFWLGNVFEIIEMNWAGLARSLQPEIIGSTGGLLAILIAWLAIRWGARRAGANVAQSQLYKWTNRGASLLAIAVVGGMVWQVFLVASTNRLPRKDVDRSAVYERMDAIIKR